jgi:hypothetical protein
MHYRILVKKPANELTREKSDATVNNAVLKYVKGRKDIRQASDKEIAAFVQDELEDDHDLDPEYTLHRTEYVMVIPNVRIDTNRRRLQSAIFKGDIDIPPAAVKRHRQRRKETGYQ